MEISLRSWSRRDVGRLGMVDWMGGLSDRTIDLATAGSLERSRQ